LTLNHHAHGALANFGGKLDGFLHGYILSRDGASTKPGAVHSAVALLPFNTDFAGFARLGFSSIHATATASQFGYTGSASQTDTKALVGVGLKYNLTKDFAFRTEYTRYASNFSTVSIDGEVKF
jgi:hypothetical protein